MTFVSAQMTLAVAQMTFVSAQTTLVGAVKTWVTHLVQDMGNTLGVLGWFVLFGFGASEGLPRRTLGRGGLSEA